MLSLLAAGNDGGRWSISGGGNSVHPCRGDAGLVVVVGEPGGDVNPSAKKEDRAGKRESLAVVVGSRYSAMEVVMGGEGSIGSRDHSSQGSDK